MKRAISEHEAHVLEGLALTAASLADAIDNVTETAVRILTDGGPGEVATTTGENELIDDWLRHGAQSTVEQILEELGITVGGGGGAVE